MMYFIYSHIFKIKFYETILTLFTCSKLCLFSHFFLILDVTS